MIKKTVSIFICFYSLIFISVLFQACRPYDASICRIWFDGIIQDNISDSETEGSIFFNLTANDNCQTALTDFKLDLVKSCTATTLCVNWQNSILKETIELSFNKEILFENETIPANSDILQYDGIKEFVVIKIEDNCDVQDISIILPNQISSLIEFEIGQYGTTFKCLTSDGLSFEEQTYYEFRNE